MRKKLLIGVLVVSVLGVAAGFFGRSFAQDNPKKAEPAQKKATIDLIDVIQKALEGKKEPLPPVPPEAFVPPVPASGTTVPALPSFPTQEKKTSSADVVPPPINFGNGLNDPQPPARLSTEPEVRTIPAPTGAKSIPSTIPPVLPKETQIPPIANPTPIKPMSVTQPALPTIPETKPELPVPITPNVAKPALPQLPKVSGPPTVQIGNAVADQVAKIKDCPWSLRVDIVKGQTIVTATVHKTHGFKIVCQTLDLQTGKNILKAMGKVHITGDMINGSCDQLSIQLLEDRLMLEGSAQVSIQKAPLNVSNLQSTFVLSADRLDVHINDIVMAQPIQSTGAIDVPAHRDVVRADSRMLPRAINDVKQWSQYGKLVRTETKTGPQWRLEKSNGEVIAYLTVREGGTLERFVGQSISVLGSREDRIGESPVLMVTHIALP